MKRNVIYICLFLTIFINYGKSEDVFRAWGGLNKYQNNNIEFAKNIELLNKDEIEVIRKCNCLVGIKYYQYLIFIRQSLNNVKNYFAYDTINNSFQQLTQYDSIIECFYPKKLNDLNFRLYNYGMIFQGFLFLPIIINKDEETYLNIITKYKYFDGRLVLDKEITIEKLNIKDIFGYEDNLHFILQRCTNKFNAWYLFFSWIPRGKPQKWVEDCEVPKYDYCFDLDLNLVSKKEVK